MIITAELFGVIATIGVALIGVIFSLFFLSCIAKCFYEKCPTFRNQVEATKAKVYRLFKQNKPHKAQCGFMPIQRHDSSLEIPPGSPRVYLLDEDIELCDELFQEGRRHVCECMCKRLRRKVPRSQSEPSSFLRHDFEESQEQLLDDSEHDQEQSNEAAETSTKWSERTDLPSYESVVNGHSTASAAIQSEQLPSSAAC